MNSNHNKNRKPRQEWEVIDVVVRENAGVEVSMLALQVPRFSFRVGTAHYPDDLDGEIKISGRVTIFNARDAANLLLELEEKYTAIREAKIDELEERKRLAQQNVTTEVTTRRAIKD